MQKNNNNLFVNATSCGGGVFHASSADYSNTGTTITGNSPDNECQI